VSRVNVSVDPGVVTLGYAVWDGSEWGNKFQGICPAPIAAGVYNASFGRWKEKGNIGGQEQAALKVTGWLRDKLKRFGRIDQIICEKMEFRSTHTGIAAVDDVLAVAFACGCVAQLAAELHASYHPAPVSIWKGNLTKVMVSRRCAKRWGGVVPDFLSDVDTPSHDWDAVGIGLWAQGFFE
jgi:hypothetical protein